MTRLSKEESSKVIELLSKHEWKLDDVALITKLANSEKIAWEEVERLKVDKRIQSRYIQEMQARAHHFQVLSGKLNAQLQDALTVISNALTDVNDMLAVSEMEGRDMELCPQATMLSLHDDLQAAIDCLKGEHGDGK
ncbi:hypothetical protein [Paenibacillus sp. 481]|uniref:hypothetical protein n=1 Tax=Paenibacillus sp. 481 TaxID=2835869 RepID=UPI001E2A55DF|nr:hypothetical protein [Paenibacillus sp. 481]UHA74429.1 hypothetical protein KIK04_04795 [Paenibacillus sp. 481]